MPQTPTYTYVAGLDIGNGYTKGLIAARDDMDNPEEIDIPSAVSIETLTNTLPMPDAEARAVMRGGAERDFYDMLDVSFTSPLVSKSHRHIFGRRSLSSNGALVEFTIDAGRSKAEQELSKVLVVGLLAARAVKDFVLEHGHIPSPVNDDDPSALKVRANVALALPINEYRQYRHAYAAAFTGDNGKLVHTVTVHNFETPVTVHVTISRVDVIAEGASAQYAITAYGKPLAQQLLDDARRTQGIELDGITPDDIVGVTHSIGVDIGEGTVNFPVFTDGKFNQDASRNWSQGYGSILERAIRTMENAGVHNNFDSRKKLADYLQRDVIPLKRREHKVITGYVDEEADFFTDRLAEEFGRVLAGAPLTEAVYVYGGGSGPIRDMAYQKLAAKVAELVPGGEMPVFYLDPTYSRKLNREGLMIAASAGTRR